jgi:hypothetical protein
MTYLLRFEAGPSSGEGLLVAERSPEGERAGEGEADIVA